MTKLSNEDCIKELRRKIDDCSDRQRTASRMSITLQKKLQEICPHLRTEMTACYNWSSWPEYGTDPGYVTCLDCRKILRENWGDDSYKERIGP